MDAKWQEWYDNVLNPLLKHSPGQVLSPELERLLARDPTQVDLALLAADTDRTQDYVFESSRLPEIRGASSHLSDLNESVGELVKQSGAYLIYAGGGGLLAFAPAQLAESLAAEIEQRYPHDTTIATITADWRPITPQMVMEGYPSSPMNPFGTLVQWASTWLRRRKENRETVPFISALPHTERCRSCLVRPAQLAYLASYPDWPLCDICHDKRAYRGRDLWHRHFQKYLDDSPEQRRRYYGDQAAFPRFDREHSLVRWTPQDLSEIGEACIARSGYVGFIYLDGDSMGQAFENTPTPRAYAALSDAVSDSAHTAVMEALAALCPMRVHPSQARGPEDQPMPGEQDELGRIRIHPFDIITIGGDDIMLITPADVALPIAASISLKFQSLMVRRLTEPDMPDAVKKHSFTLSGGVVLASDHNPVRILRDLAKELQREAKKARKLAQAHESYLDFLILKSADMLDRSVRGARMLYPYKIETSDKALRLLSRPYRASTLSQLWNELCDLRVRGFPTSQMQLLAESLLHGRQESSLFYLYQSARQHARKKSFEQLTNVLRVAHESDDPKHPIPWHNLAVEQGKQYAVLKKDFGYQTALWDIAELYDFVPTRKEASG